MNNNHTKFQIFNSFALKLIAIITMTLDHIGMFLIQFSKVSEEIILKDLTKYPMGTTGYIFRCIGRIAMPLFCAMVAEAMIHSKDRKKYLTRLGIGAIAVIFTCVLINYVLPLNITITGSNIFLALLCGASFIYFFESKDYKKLLILLPISLVILSTAIDFAEVNGIKVLWWPSFLRCEYSLYGFIFIIGFYFSYYLSDYFILSSYSEKGLNKKLSSLRKMSSYRTFTNIMWMLVIILTTFIFWILAYVNPKLDAYCMDYQEWAIVAIIPLFLYNGNKGYRSEIIKYGFYLYYPLHLLIIVLGFYLGFGYWVK